MPVGELDEEGAHTYADENVNETQRGGRPSAAGVSLNAVGGPGHVEGAGIGLGP